MKYKTVGYKGSKRKLLEEIESHITPINAETVLDGFSGSGIVSAHLRKKGYKVFANDKMASCNLFAKVFLRGYNKKAVEDHIKKINSIEGKTGWLTQNYSGEKMRMIKGIKKMESRPLGFLVKNSRKIDAARDYTTTIKNVDDQNAVIFSIVLAMNRVFNNSNDQKSCFKEWSSSSRRDIKFECPTLIDGHKGEVFSGDILDLPRKRYDVVYLDPPYTNGVLYDSCYHLNDSVCLWDKPTLDYSFAIPRPNRAIFRKNNKTGGKFYSKKTAQDDFTKLLEFFECKRIILSYSDAPRNILKYQDLFDICDKVGTLNVFTRDHKLCAQANSQEKVSTNLTEFFFVIDKNN